MSALAQSAIVPIFVRICPGAFAIISFFARSHVCMFHVCTFAQSCLMQTSSRSCFLANLRSVLVQFPSQDCRLAIPRSTLGQSPSHDQPSVIWRSTLGQKIIAQSALDSSSSHFWPTCHCIIGSWPIRTLPFPSPDFPLHSELCPFTLSTFLCAWGSSDWWSAD